MNQCISGFYPMITGDFNDEISLDGRTSSTRNYPKLKTQIFVGFKNNLDYF